MSTLIKCIIIVCSSALFSACGGSSTTTTQPVTNVAPIANTGTDINTDENTTVTLNGSSSTDSDGSIASYAWVQTSGTNVAITNANQSTATFTAPDVDTDTQLTFQLTVTDDDGATDSDTITVSILDTAVANQPPTAVAGNNFNADENTTVTLNGSSTDSDGSIASYAWVQTLGTNVAITNANQSTATFTAPNVDTDTQLTFQLTVTDDDGATNSDTITVSILDIVVANQQPTAVAGNNFSADENTTVTLDGSSSSDPDGAIVSFSWAQIAGTPTISIINSTLASASFTAPDISTNTPLTFELTVTDDDGAINSSSVVVTITIQQGSVPIVTDARSYIFGHSLINHEHGEGNELTNIPLWIHELSQQAGYTYTMDGQYGFSSSHASELPPDANWSIPQVTGIWNSEGGESFAEANFNTILFTAANFRQEFPASAEDPNWPEPVTTSTLTVFDWVETADPGNRFIIYENWPDMGGYTSANFSTTFPTTEELASYYSYTQGAFHEWWVAYQDEMLAQRPNLDVRMIPVGPILATLLTTTLSDIPSNVLYEDDAPHGRPTLYFLAGLITYMGIYGVEAPADYVVSHTIDNRVQTRYNQIAAEIWTELQNFVDHQGNSLVFPN